MQLDHIAYYLKRALGCKALSIEQVASNKRVLCPAEHGAARPAIYLKGDLERITGYPSTTTAEREWARVKGGRVEHAATKAYQVENSRCLGGFLYSGMWKMPLVSGWPNLMPRGCFESVEDAVMVSSYCGNRYFGHWVTDDLPLQLAGSELGTPVVHGVRSYIHADGYLKLFELNPRVLESAEIQKLTIISDYSQNSYKRIRYQSMREGLRKKIKAPPSVPGVFVRRGVTGVSRELTNEREIERYLESLGFISISPEELSPEEILRKSLGARFVVGCEGSHMGHFLYSIGENGTLICLEPPYQFTAVHKDYADCLGYNFGVVVGDQSGHGFSIPVSSLEQVMELAETRMSGLS